MEPSSPPELPPEAAAAVAAGFGIVAIVCLVAFLLPFIFYLISMQKALSRVAPDRRTMTPGLVWLMLIPLFGLVWQFFVVVNVCKSLKKEFEARGIAASGDSYGWPIGLTMCILFCCGIIPFLGILASLAGLVLWIIWWVKVAGYSGRIATPATT